MAAEVETLLKPKYLETETGQNLRPLAELLESGQLPNSFSAYMATKALAFLGNNAGRIITKWHDSGILVLSNPNGTKVTKQELLAIQVLKVLAAYQNPGSYHNVYEQLVTTLAGSGLEGLIGDNPDSSYLKYRPNVHLLFPQDPWYFDPLEFNSGKRFWNIDLGR